MAYEKGGVNGGKFCVTRYDQSAGLLLREVFSPFSLPSLSRKGPGAGQHLSIKLQVSYWIRTTRSHA